jgi:peptide/nickel transport system permease protein
MTETPAAPPAAAPARVQGKDYWDIVVAQMSRKWSFRVSLAVLVLLYAAAVYAPFLANDRPLYLKAVDVAGYRKALREMSLGADGLAQRIEEGGSGLDAATLASDRRAIELRIATVRRQLAPADRALPDELAAAVSRTVDAARDGGAAAAAPEAARVHGLVARIRAELEPAEPGEAPAPGRTVALVPYASFPALGNLGRLDAFFMTMWILILTFPAWNRVVNRGLLKGERLRIRRARKTKMIAMAAVPAAAALAWQGSTSDFFLSSYKAGLTDGGIRAETVIFPPVAYGIAESNDSETFRPPTWHPEAEISPEGYYVRGPRAGRFDPTTRIPRPAQPVKLRFAEPDANSPLRHPLGTDSLGRDLAARMIWGGRVSLAVGLVSTVLLVTIGVVVGSVAGYYGGWVDMVLSRLIEIVQTFPVFFLILILVAFVGPSILNIMLVIGLVRWTGVARLVRGEFIRLREQDFVVASRALGVRSGRTIFRHVLPNAMSPVLVAATFSVAAGILIESGLSFLGFGIQLPIPSWGSLFIESRSAEHWWIQIFPGLLIFVTVLLYNLLGESVRDALDPRLKGAS